MKAALLAILLAVAIAGPAEARHREPPTLVERLAGALEGFVRRAAAAAATSGAVLAEASQRAPMGQREALYEDGRIVPNPTGCPPRLFCGCGVSIKVYGRPIPALYSAASWGRFPKASCGSGRVAVFSGHVAYILACNGDGTALAYDPNSGGGLTRVHTIILPSLIVEPPASL
jgi:hypothetical protein